MTDTTPVVDLAGVRERFPALGRLLDGAPCVFADAPGGTQVPREVIAAMAEYLRRSNANTGGAFPTSAETDQLIESARRSGSALLGCEPEEVVFGPNTTTLAFALSRAVARELRPGDELVVTMLDHDANIAPWLLVAEDTAATVRWVDITEPECRLSAESLHGALGPRTRVVALTAASNAVGTVTDLATLIPMVRDAAPGALVVVDAVHLAPHRVIDVQALDADILFCSAYKFFGPHLGLMAGRRDRLEALRPFKVRPADDRVPWRWETGTLNHEALAGLVATIRYLEDLGRDARGRPEASPREAIVAAMQAVAASEAALSRRFLEGLRGVGRIRLYGIADAERVADRTPTFALRMGDRPPRDVAEDLGRQGIFVWDGNYYALAVMERLGLEESGGAVRVGFCHYNTIEEVDRVLNALSSMAAGGDGS